MMRLIPLVLAASLSACGPDAPPASPGATPAPAIVAKADTVILTGERAFAVAELAYTVAANGVGRAVDAGLIHGATATKVRTWNARARALLITGKATADKARKAQAAAELLGIADSLNALIGVK